MPSLTGPRRRLPRQVVGARALIVVENLSVPFDRRVWQEARALVDAGYRVSVICPMGAERDTEPFAHIEGVDIHRYRLATVPNGGAGAYLREYLTAVFKSLRIAWRLGRFDVVHICNPPDLLFLVVLPLKLRGARVIFDQHDLVPELYLSRFGRGADRVHRALTMAERLTYRVADVVMSTNQSYRDVALRRGRKRPDRVFVVRSAPDLARFTAVPPDPSLRKGAEHLLCYVGVMGPQDGVDYALRSLARLRDELGRSDWHAVFVGGGDAHADAVRLTSQLGLDAHATFTGFDPDVARYICSADVCLAPDPTSPLNDVSTMNKIVEYMALGKPVVSFDLTESRYSAGDAALYAPANDEGRFAAAIAELLDDPARRAAMGEIGRARVAGPLSWDRSREALLAAYATALGVAPPRQTAAAEQVDSAREARAGR